MKTGNTNKPTGITLTQFEDAMKQYAAAENRETEINKAIDLEVNELIGGYEGELMLLAQGKRIAFDTVQHFCEQNKDTLFTKRRSIGCLHGMAGFRLGTPRLKTLKGSNWNKVVNQLKEKLPDYVRISEEPAKDLLLADRHKENVAPLLREIGVEVIQEELFYIETKRAA